MKCDGAVQAYTPPHASLIVDVDQSLDIGNQYVSCFDSLTHQCRMQFEN